MRRLLLLPSGACNHLPQVSLKACVGHPQQAYTGTSSADGSPPSVGEPGQTGGAANGAQTQPQAAASYAPGSPESAAAVQGAVAASKGAHQ